MWRKKIFAADQNLLASAGRSSYNPFSPSMDDPRSGFPPGLGTRLSGRLAFAFQIPVNKLRAGEGTLTTCDKEVVAALGQDIAQRIGEPRFNFWFEGNTKFTLEEQALTVGVPNLFFQDWLQNTFGESVRAAAGARSCRSVATASGK